MSDDFEKPNKLDNLEASLYSPRYQMEAKARKPLRPKDYAVAQSWETSSQTPLENTPMSVDRSRKNWFFRFFMLAFLFFIVALGYVGFKFVFDGGIKADDVDILVNAPLTVGAGEVFAFDVLLQNKNQMNMQTVDITINFPDGTRSVSNISEDYDVNREQVGDIAIGAVSKKSYSALLFGEEGDKKEVNISISYRVEGSNALFEKEKNFEVVLKSTPVRLTVTNVKEITSGQPLTFNVELVSNSTQVLENVMVQATYPFGFMYKGSSIRPEEGNRTWIIPRLEPKEVINFTIDGTIEGQNNEERYFGFSTGLKDKNSDGPQVVFSTTGTTISLARPFLELDLAINNNNSDVIPLNADSIYDVIISYKNNTTDPLRNLKLTLQLAGEAINKSSVQVSEGFYQSLNNTVVWDSSTNSRFASVSVGSSGTVSFNFSGLGLENNSVLVNPEVTLTALVEGNRNPDNEVPEVIESSLIKKIRFNSQVNVDAISEHYTATFSNTGPIPPVAEQKTYYTAVIEVANPSNKVEDSIVTMFIPNYVTYENKFVPSGENVSFDPVTRILTWNLGTINEKTGYSGNPKRKLSFQVSIIPSISQVGLSPVLVDSIKFLGYDAHTQQDISIMQESITTSALDAKSFYDSQVSK